MPTIEETYQARHARSAALHRQARGHFPGGITHDGRWASPFPLAIERASGARKWDVDGHELIDYWMGHGALLLGHGHPAVVAAVQRQVQHGTHLGGSTPHEIRWAELVRACFPGIERLRFTASGTEATMLALRLARAATGRPTVIRFAGHFHGWNDALAQGADGHTSVLAAGLHPALAQASLVLDTDLDVVARTLRERRDVAAVILEPSGASYGQVPLDLTFLRELRRLTAEHDVLLIADEVVTGFRLAPGGQQERAGVQADLTCLAKLLAGGLPGGAVGGRAALMDHLELRDAAWNERHKVRHNGTYNANPLSAAAGIATLELLRDNQPQAQAAASAARLIAGINERLAAAGLGGWAAYGDGSIVHLLIASSVDFPPGPLPLAELSAVELKAGGGSPRLKAAWRLATLNEGLDLMRGTAGFVSIAHGPPEVTASLAAVERAIAAMRRDGLV